MPGWKVRDMIDRIDRDQQKTSNHIVGGQRKLSYGEFEHVRRIEFYNFFIVLNSILFLSKYLYLIIIYD
jgi:hypothetical protein